MFTPSHHHSRSVSMKILSGNQRQDVVNAAYGVLETAGFRVSKASARDMLKKAGATVSDDLVYVPRFIVRQCLNTCPDGIQIYDRKGAPALNLWGTNVYYGTSTASPNTKDALNGEIHPTKVKDIEIGAKLGHSLANIDFVMPFGSSQDVDSNVAELYEFEAVVTNTTKPVVFCSYSPRGMEYVFEMAALVAGGKSQLKARPFIISYPEPISPLTYPEEIVDKIFLSADWGIPQITCGGGQLGATSPVTLAGTLVQMLAESMLSITLAQLHKPGAPVFMACNAGAFDMRYGMHAMASPEGSLIWGAMAEIGRNFGLPSWGCAGVTDSKVLDAQAGAESAFTMMAQGMAGVNVIHDVGYMDGGMICSADMLVMGNEIAGMIKRFAGGIDTSPDQLACDVIKKVGAGGNYLQEQHTLQNFKQCWYPDMFARQSFSAWADAGSKSLADKCSEKVRELLESHVPPALEDGLKEKIRQIRIDGEKEILKTK